MYVSFLEKFVFLERIIVQIRKQVIFINYLGVKK